MLQDETGNPIVHLDTVPAEVDKGNLLVPGKGASGQTKRRNQKDRNKSERFSHEQSPP
jgi:hypothetical protein